MCDIPEAVANEETIVRGLRECHVSRKGKLRDNVFRSAAQTDEVSVMRFDFLGSNFCKTKTKEIASRDANNPYVGLAAIRVQSVRTAGSQVTDSRDEFCGHAHISHGMPSPPPEEPLDPLLIARLRTLNSAAKLFLDPSPDVDAWTGPAITV